MVYVIALDEPVPAIAKGSDRPYFTKAMPVSAGFSARTRLALVLTRVSDAARQRERTVGPVRYELTHLGVVLLSSRQKVSTYDRLLKVEELFPLPCDPLKLEWLLAALPPAHQEDLAAMRGGSAQVLPDELGEVLLRTIRDARPAADSIIDWLQALDRVEQLGSSAADQFWLLDRDAANIALHIGGYSPTPLRAWRRPDDSNQPFFAGLVPVPQPPEAQLPESPDELQLDLIGLVPEASEPALIENDARTFAG